MLENSTTIGLETLAEHIKHEIGQHDDYISPTAFRSMQSILHLREHILLESVNISLTSIAATDAGTVDVVCGVGLSAPNLPTDPYKFGSAIARPVLNSIVSVYDLEYIAYILDRYFGETFSHAPRAKPSQSTNTKWWDHLNSRGSMLDNLHELDWSVRGRHMEYDEQSEKDIPLLAEKVLGHSATAIVESVMCRRIFLTRKKITCT
jgi:hypothetical protein